MTRNRPDAAMTIDTWQHGLRAQGLASFDRIVPNLMAVNAQDVFSLDYQAYVYDLYELSSVVRVMTHPAVSSMAVITAAGDVLLEHYGRGHDRRSTFSDQSCTKTMGYLLLKQALRDGHIRLEDRIEQHLPEIGPGFHGRTVGDVASMAVNHNVAELAAYTGDPAALAMFNRDERVIGMQRNDQRETLRQFIQDIQVGDGDSTEWTGDIANYATINTSVLGLAIERATQVPLADLVRRLLHTIGGENTVSMVTDFDGVPVIGAGLVASTVDFARYGRLLLDDSKQVVADRESANTAGQPVPVDLTHVESRYYKSAIHNDFGIGHSGWGGQLVWADPDSAVIIAINSQLASKLPAPYDHFNKLYTAAIDIVKYCRADQIE
jgi:CubicO group peptidase (beta-lactamase class C family)